MPRNDNRFANYARATENALADTEERPIPRNIDAEKSVLAACLLSDEVVEEILIKLRPENFFRPAHRIIFESIMDLVALDENAEGADTVMQSDINGVYFVFLQGEDGTWFAIDALGLNGAACRFLFTLKDPESTQGQTVAWLMIDSMQHAE